MPGKNESNFIEGPQSRGSELLFTLKVLRDFIKGFRVFHFLGPCATVFGSARYNADHEYYELTRKMGSELAKMGFTLMTGGGPGLMEAANKGAREAGGRSVGCNIVLPSEQHHNPYLDKWVNIDYFFVRKVLLTKYSYAFIVMPGGYGTLDEFFEAITLIQTHKAKPFPVVLMGKEYHAALYNHIQHMVKAGTIAENDARLFLLTDSVTEAIEHVRKYAIERFNLKKFKRQIKPIWLFGEKNGN